MMHFGFIFFILIICVSLQINANPCYMIVPNSRPRELDSQTTFIRENDMNSNLDDREVAERIVDITMDIIYIIENTKNKFSMNLKIDIIKKFTERVYKLCTNSRRRTVYNIMKNLKHCKAISEPVTFSWLTQKSDSCQSSISTVESTTQTVPGAIILSYDKIRKELWNQNILPINFLKFIIEHDFEHYGYKVEHATEFIQLLKSFMSENLKELGNRIWYGILLINLLNIKSHSDDETLKELWHEIPEPSIIPEFGLFTLKELWNKQTLPPLIPYEPRKQSDFLESIDETIEDVWDKIHYQLLFYRIWQIKYRYDYGILKHRNNLIPLPILEQRNCSIRELWNELVQPNIITKNGDDTFRKLAVKLYLPLLSQVDEIFLPFDDYKPSIEIPESKYIS